MSGVRVHVFVEGRVQGVWFRESTRRRAVELGVTGFARNLSDGRVECVFEGDPTAVEDAVAFVREGPPMARVARVEVVPEPFTGDFEDFSPR